MVMYERRFQPTMIIVVVFHLRGVWPMWLAVVIVFLGCYTLFFSLCGCYSPPFCPIRFPSAHIAYLCLCWGYKKKCAFFGCRKTFPSREWVFMCYLRIGSTQTAPFLLMLSLAWNTNIFHHPRSRDPNLQPNGQSSFSIWDFLLCSLSFLLNIIIFFCCCHHFQRNIHVQKTETICHVGVKSSSGAHHQPHKMYFTTEMNEISIIIFITKSLPPKNAGFSW